MRHDAPKLDSAINAWYADISKSKYLKYTSNKYLSRSNYFDLVVSEGYISPYDSIFRLNADVLGWDWRFLAAMAFNESRFNPNTVSANGAIGIMQLIWDAIRLARKYGSNPQKWSNIEKYLLLKSKPKYYNDKVVKLGYFRAQHTSRFVKDVFATYNKYISLKIDK